MELYKDISSLELNNMIGNKEKLILLDVRTKAEYNTGRIPNSVNIPVGDLDAQIEQLLPYKDEKIILYCRSGKRSVYAAHLLSEYGFKHLYNLKQGIIGHLSYL